MSTNNREFDFFALMTSLEAHMLDKLFKDGALTAELWLMGDPADGRRSSLKAFFDRGDDKVRKVEC